MYAVQVPECVGLCRMVEIPHYYEQLGVTTSTWCLLCEDAFCRIFTVHFADMALARDLGDVKPCRIEVLQWIQYAGGLSPAGGRFLAFLGRSACRRSCDSRQWELLKTCRFLFPWLGDALDKNHGLEAPSAHGGEAEHTSADLGDVQHVSDEVLEAATASLHAGRVALSDEQEERTLAATGSAYDAKQGHASAQWKPGTSANSTASTSQCVLIRGIPATALQEPERARGAPNTNFS